MRACLQTSRARLQWGLHRPRLRESATECHDISPFSKLSTALSPGASFVHVAHERREVHRDNDDDDDDNDEQLLLPPSNKRAPTKTLQQPLRKQSGAVLKAHSQPTPSAANKDEGGGCHRARRTCVLLPQAHRTEKKAMAVSFMMSSSKNPKNYTVPLVEL